MAFAAVLALLLGVLTWIAYPTAGSAQTRAASQSQKVAYVYDAVDLPNSGVSDFGGMFARDITGSGIGSNGTGTYNGAIFTDVKLADLDANPASLTGYDTVLMYQVCHIGEAANTAALTAINSFLAAGGKVMIFDADACAPNIQGVADYSRFLFPFTTSSPGPRGATQCPTPSGQSQQCGYTAVEASTLTTGLMVGPVTEADSVGDGNTFTSNAGGWCASLTATNTLGNTGFIEAYARTPSGGLAIYEGEDTWATFGADAHRKKVFDLVLAQPWRPDGLPCGVPTSGIKLDPATDTKTVGQTETLTATVSDSTGAPKSGVAVVFTVSSGPDSGKTGTHTTDANGKATFDITNTSGPGVDKVTAKFTDTDGGLHTSNESDITWVAATPTATPTPTPTPTHSATPTPTPTPTHTPTPTPTPTASTATLAQTGHTGETPPGVLLLLLLLMLLPFFGSALIVAGLRVWKKRV